MITKFRDDAPESLILKTRKVKSFMSKNKNNGKFSNRAARRFNDLAKIDTMDQSEIFEILTEDMDIMLDQVTAFRDHKPNSPYPQYIGNAFANLSTPLFFSEYVDEHVKVKKKGKKVKTDLDEAKIESLRAIISDAYKKSATNFYANQLQEFTERNELLSKTFMKLYPEVYRKTKKFDGLSKSQRRDLTIQIYGDPAYNMRFIHKLINQSTLTDKKKLKLLCELYGKKRFVKAVGAAMIVEGNNSDCLAMLFEYMQGLKKKKRAKYLKAYADAYKKAKTKYFRIDKNFYDENKRIIKELGRLDIGYKKAFKDLKGGKSTKKRDDQRNKDRKF